MGYMATWGPKGFLVSPSKVVTLQDLTTSLNLKEDSENDTSGTEPTNTRGRELRPISFSVQYFRAAGVDPRGQIAEWESNLGNAYPLIIGGRRFGEEKMKLTSVETSDIMLTTTGEFLSATVAITLEEYSDGKTSKLLDKNSGTGTTNNKKAALSATASTTDRANKKTGGSGNESTGQWRRDRLR